MECVGVLFWLCIVLIMQCVDCVKNSEQYNDFVCVYCVDHIQYCVLYTCIACFVLAFTVNCIELMVAAQARRTWSRSGAPTATICSSCLPAPDRCKCITFRSPEESHSS